MSDIVQELRDDDLPFGVREGMAHAAADEIERLRNEIRRLYSEQNAMREECDQFHAELTDLRDLLHEAAPFTRFVQHPADLWKRIRAALGDKE